MFMDKRGTLLGGAGNKIVVCCEGNAAFYELGICEIALSREWNSLQSRGVKGRKGEGR